MDPDPVSPLVLPPPPPPPPICFQPRIIMTRRKTKILVSRWYICVFNFLYMHVISLIPVIPVLPLFPVFPVVLVVPVVPPWFP